MNLSEYYNHFKIGKDKKFKVRCETEFIEYFNGLTDKEKNKVQDIMIHIADFIYNGVDNFPSSSHYPLMIDSHKPRKFIEELIKSNANNSVIAFKTPLNNNDVRIVILKDPLLFVCFANHSEIG